jgi:hypothetical protein
MNESFLHYIWQCQYFNREGLKTTNGELLSIFKNGVHNTDAGPDFSNAKIKIGDIDWAGHVEIHINSSDWNQHRHHLDAAYDNVILHVVWKHDLPIIRKDGSVIPTLALADRVESTLVTSYQKLVNSAFSIPCAKSFAKMEDLIKLSMLDKALMQRLNSKSALVLAAHAANKGDWEETLYQQLAKNFGFKVNAEPFLRLASTVPFRMLKKQSNSLLQIEALLLGGAGMLETKIKDEYVASLYREYQLLKTKYSLGNVQLHSAQWKFLRLRPANFPTLRIAQFASLLYHNRNFFSQIVETESLHDVYKLFEVNQSDYWQNHYRFGSKSQKKVAALGESSIQNIIINSIVPVLVSYGQTIDDNRYVERAIQWLENLPTEKNKITRVWEDIGMKVKSSFDSQALIEQYNNMCQKRNCLNCVIGSTLLKPSSL